jgi:high affinity sulfate transporter 1
MGSQTSSPVLPIVGHLKGYSRADFGGDVVAGLVLTALLVPAGMGYAQASGLPAVNGLYATIIPLLVYALVGPSRILVVGPDSTLAPLILAAIVPLAATRQDTGQLVALAGVLSIMAGIIGLIAGLLRMGFVADLLSGPVRAGYMNGIVLTVLVSQVPKLLGFSVPSVDVVPRTRDIVRAIADGEVVLAAAGIGVGSLALVLVTRRLAPRVPGTLLAVVLSIVAVIVLGLDDADLSLVGDMPRGLPAPDLPGVSFDDVVALIGPAIGIAFVSFADTSVLSRTLSSRRGEKVDPDRELAAVGLVNAAAGMFQGFPVSASSSRTPVAEAAGSRTQVTGVVGAVTVASMIVVAPTAFRHLPEAALAAVVVAAVLRLVDIGTLRHLARVRRSDLVLSVVAFLGVAVLGAIPGIGVAVGLSLLDVMRRAWRPHSARLVRVDGLKGYHDSERHPEGRAIPGLLLFRFDAPLFFANGAHFVQDVLDAVEDAQDVAWVVVTAEPITDVDTTAAEELTLLLDELDRAGVVFAFAELKGQVRDSLGRYGLVDRIGPDRFYRTIGEAVRAYVDATGTDWTDWEDAPRP